MEFIKVLVLLGKLLSVAYGDYKENTVRIAIVQVEMPEVPIYDIPLDEDLQVFTYRTATYYDFGETFIHAIMDAESTYRDWVTSYTGCCHGLMQLHDNTYPSLAQELEIDNFDVFNPYHNIEAGILYLYQLRENWRELEYSEEDVFALTLLSYNRGHSRAIEFVRNGGDIWADDYVNKVLDAKLKLERMDN